MAGGANADQEFGAGRIIAEKYRILGVLGRGGFGTVYRVEMIDGIVSGHLALKVLHPNYSSLPAKRERFIREIRIAMQVVSKYVVQIRDVGVTDDGRIYYTMDHVEGCTLAELLAARGRPLSPKRVLRLGRRILSALTSAHAAGVIHRDLKPANIMVSRSDPGERVYVLDFGLASRVEDLVDPQGRRVGTIRYMAPEQLEGGSLDLSVDVHAAGLVLYECLTGRRVHEGDSSGTVAESIRAGNPPHLETLAPGVRSYPGLAHAIHKALRHNPSRRWRSAREFFDELTAIQRRARESIAAIPQGAAMTRQSAARPASRRVRRSAVGRSGPGSSRGCRRGARPELIVLALVCAALGAAALIAWGRQGPEPRPPTPVVESEPPVESRVARASTDTVSPGARRAGSPATRVEPAPAEVTGVAPPGGGDSGHGNGNDSGEVAAPVDVEKRPATIGRPPDRSAPRVEVTGDRVVGRPPLSVGLIISDDSFPVTVTVERGGSRVQQTTLEGDGGRAVSWSPRIFVPSGHECSVSIVATDAAENRSTPHSIFLRATGPARAAAKGPVGSPLDGDRVNRGILEGARFLRGEIENYLKAPAQRVSNDWNDWGLLALMTWAAVDAGIPYDDGAIQASLSYLAKLRSVDGTYATACYVLALKAVVDQTGEDADLLHPMRTRAVRLSSSLSSRLRECVRTLTRGQNRRGGWRYMARSQDADLSCTQFALLALAAAAELNVPFPQEVWDRATGYVLRSVATAEGPGGFRITTRSQNGTLDPESGENVELRGFRYNASKGPTWNMTCAGLSSLHLVASRARHAPDVSSALDGARRSALAWIERHWAPASLTGYGAYSFEKVASAYDLVDLGGRDWFEEVSTALLARQHENGSWPAGPYGKPPELVETALSLLAMNRATERSLSRGAPRSVVLPGPAPAGDARGAWVFLRKRGASYHVPSLVRLLRLRPSRTLVDLVSEILDPDAARGGREPGDFVLDLARAMAGADRKARTEIQGMLESITGAEYDDPADLEAWYARWCGARGGDRDEAWLLRALEHTTGSPTLRAELLRALGRLESFSIGVYLNDMGHRDADVRSAAHGAFRAIFRGHSGPCAPPPFDPLAPDRTRAEQLLALRDWVEGSAWLKGW